VSKFRSSVSINNIVQLFTRSLINTQIKMTMSGSDRDARALAQAFDQIRMLREEVADATKDYRDEVKLSRKLEAALEGEKKRTLEAREQIEKVEEEKRKVEEAKHKVEKEKNVLKEAKKKLKQEKRKLKEEIAAEGERARATEKREAELKSKLECQVCFVNEKSTVKLNMSETTSLNLNSWFCQFLN
jgi:septal ring factor EnvC (AmiA/AmiB activator)